MSEGETKQLDGVKCRKCSAETVTRAVWESSDGAFEDYHFCCTTCGRDWWVDGPDA